ncbi:hydrogenase [Methanobrevibacter sp. UBA212]|jgi:energy-converting hydrogenase B subunit G|uniref:hydrogenase n=1 Tax=Methanobrevibacter sp. UBA212 TaxID=1915476 RepID=UPI0025EEA077|nr:hydrogenase [Methanobrevibacter sp. UBA212]MEE1149893.1 hydrogenase [Methanobrevibacter sp.]
MKLYDQIFNVVKQFRKLFSPGPVTNADVSGSLTAEIFLIVSLVLSAILLRHVNVLLAGIFTLILAIVLIYSIPLIPKFKIEQEDSLEKMLFYAIITLALIAVFMYWGGNLV